MTQPTAHSPGTEPSANNLAALVQSFADWLDRRRLRLCCAVLLALELAIFLVLIAGTHGWIVPLEHATTTDFASFYAAGALANAGTPQLAYDQAAHYAMEQAVTAAGIEYQFFNYPPVYLILCAALAHLPYLVAFVLFIAATLAFYVAVARHVLDDRSITALLVLAAFPMVFWTIGLGQNAFLTAALFGMATLWIDRRPVAAGLLFGLLCYKPHFGLLLPIALAAGGYWRSFAAAAVSAGSLILLSLLLFGWDTWHAFFVTAGASHAVYESGRILFAGFANPFGAVRLLGGPVTLAYLVQGAASLAAAALVFIVWRCRLSLGTRAAILAAASIVAAPVVIFYDLMLGTIAACWLVRDESHPVSPAEKTFFAGITLLLLDVRHLGEAWHLPVAATASLGLLAIAASRACRELAQEDPAWSLWRWWGKRYAT
jgi:alpha-1,2-mannosyltransferase